MSGGASLGRESGCTAGAKCCAGMSVGAAAGASSSARRCAPSSGTWAAKTAPAIQVLAIKIVRSKKRGLTKALITLKE